MSNTSTPKASTKRFDSGDKVFAKVRGYPPWPAKVHGLVDETPNKLRYQVFFYGTRETAVCKAEELYDYLEYRDKHGKLSKRKFFSEALDEIERELDPSVRRDDLLLSVQTPTSADTTLNMNETPNRVKAKGDSAKSAKRKHTPGFDGNVTDTPELPPKTKVTSRSGRKIKPKKFLDEPHEQAQTTSAGVADMLHSTEEVESSDEDVNLCPPTNEQVSTDDASHKTKSAQLRNKVEEIKNQTTPFVGENLDVLKIEVQLLDSDCRIKSSLSLSRANCDECLRAMDEVMDLKLTPLMLKKHPEVVDTVKKLRRYVGNVEKWNLPSEKEEIFKEKASRIRLKADHMYSKFKSLFTVPTGKTFLEVYNAEVQKFNEKIVNLTTNELYGLTREPAD